MTYERFEDLPVYQESARLDEFIGARIETTVATWGYRRCMASARSGD